MSAPELRVDADVLVLGGGMAGAWAAFSAAREGASVVLVDKGCCGTSVMAAAGPGHWWVAPADRDAAVAERARAALGLAEEDWMHRILEATWDELPGLAPHYRFPVVDGRTVYHAMRGPEYGRALRDRLDACGVRVLDHHPALELLLHGDGSVAGARGLALQAGVGWRVRAGATVVATGGCAFLSKLLGADNNTGDGALMAAEAGAELSGMEFTNGYCIAPAGTTMTRSMSYVFADYFDADGQPLHIGPGPDFTARLARALMQGPVCDIAQQQVQAAPAGPSRRCERSRAVPQAPRASRGMRADLGPRRARRRVDHRVLGEPFTLEQPAQPFDAPVRESGRRRGCVERSVSTPSAMTWSLRLQWLGPQHSDRLHDSGDGDPDTRRWCMTIRRRPKHHGPRLLHIPRQRNFTESRHHDRDVLHPLSDRSVSARRVQAIRRGLGPNHSALRRRSDRLLLAA